MTQEDGQSWGRYPRAVQQLLPLERRTSPMPSFVGTALPRGNGCSYGDSCLNHEGNLLLARPLDRFVAFDPSSGILRCEPGVTLQEVIAIALPHGWFLPVTPGTGRVTVGGAIANDVHGKNHHRMGTFGCHVIAFELLRSDGSRHVLRADSRGGLFDATIGGLGLTGLITWAELQLRRVSGPMVDAECIRFGRLEDFFTLSMESDARYEYTVAWIDCLARGKSLGRGCFFRGNHAGPAHHPENMRRRAEFSIPVTPPFPIVNRVGLRLFNALYYWRQSARSGSSLAHYHDFFYPLDSIGSWNRMYGPRGFMQHQCVLPPETAREAVAELLTEASGSTGSFLVVLKEFGAIASPGMLSFPRQGTTLALDFANNGRRVLRLLDRMNRIVEAAGGAIYPAKDAQMSASVFRAGYPRWHEFSEWIDPRFSSGFWRRVSE